MAVRINIPGLTRRKQEPNLEARYSQTLGSGYSVGNFGSGLASASLLGTGESEFDGSEVGYRAVKLKVSNLASLDLAIETKTVDKKTKEEELELSKTDPICDLWNKDPQSGIDAVVFKRIVFGQFEKAGQAFVYTPRADAKAVPEGLFNIFGKVLPVVEGTAPQTHEEALKRAIFPQIAGYQITTQQGVFGLLPHEVMWFRDPQYFVTYGAESTWNAASWPTELDKFARQWQSAEFQNGGQPTGVIYLGDLSEEQATWAKAGFEQNHSGAANAKRHLFLYGSNQAKYERIGTTPDEMSYNESHTQNQRDTLIALGVPIDLIMGQSTFDNQQAAKVLLWSDELTSIKELFESQIDKHLLPDTNRRAILDTSGVAALQENEDAIQDRISKIWQDDLLTWKEARSKLGLSDDNEENSERDDMTITEFRAQFKQAPVVAAVDPDLGTTNGGQDNEEDGRDPNADEDPVDDKASGEDAEGDSQTEEKSASQPLEVRAGEDYASTGVMVAFMIPIEQAQEIAVDGGEAPELLHCTLAYLGKTTDGILDQAVIQDVVNQTAANFSPLSGSIAGKGVFDIGDEGAVAIGLVDVVGLGELRAKLVAALIAAGQNVNEDHGYCPHISFGYAADDVEAAAYPVPVGVKLNFDALTLAWGDEHTETPMSGTAYRMTNSDLTWSLFEHRADKETAVVGYSDAEAERIMNRYEATLKRAVTRLADKQERIVMRKFEKAYRKNELPLETRAENEDSGADEIFQVEYWRNETEEVFDNVVDSLYFDVAHKFGEGLGVAFDKLSPKVLPAIAEQVKRSAQQVTETTRDKIGKILAKGLSAFDGFDEMAKTIRGVFAELRGSRAEMIARTEVSTGFSSASILVARESEIVRTKELILSREPCPICVEIQAATPEIRLDEEFHGGFDTAPFHPNCMCHVRYGVERKRVESERVKGFEETEHPRDGDGKFADKASSKFDALKELGDSLERIVDHGNGIRSGVLNLDKRRVTQLRKLDSEMGKAEYPDPVGITPENAESKEIWDSAVLRSMVRFAQGNRIRIAQDSDGRVVGVFDYQINLREHNNSIDVTNVRISGDVRGNGIGSKIMAALAQDALSADAEKPKPKRGPMTMKVRGILDSAIPFYARLGVIGFGFEKNLNKNDLGEIEFNDLKALADGKPKDRSEELEK